MTEQSEFAVRRKLLTDALRSGIYKQYKSCLRNPSDPEQFCCLGVACEIYKEQASSGFWNGSDFVVSKEDFSDECLPDEVKYWYGFQDSYGEFFERDSLSATGKRHFISLSKKNDGGASFAEIADIIDSNPTGLFVVDKNEQ